MSTATAPTTPQIGFAPIPLSILLDRHLSPESKLTYLIIRTHDRGHGCFACRETLALEIGLSPYHIRKGICELLDRGTITVEKRRMGLTDLVRLTDHDWGLPSNDPTEELSEPSFEAPPEPELSEEPLLPVQPVEDAVEFVEEPVEVELESDEEPVEDAVKPLDSGLEDVSSRSSNHLNYKYDAFKKDASKYITPSTKLDRIEDTGQTNQKTEWKDLIRFFYQKKENRNPTQNEIFNWKPTATRLLSEFPLSELLSATQYAIEKGARLFYYVALTAPGYIVEHRQQRKIELQHAQIDSKAIEAQNEREYRLETLRCSAREFDAQTKDLLAGLEAKMRPQTFRVWFRDTFIVNATEDTMTLTVASQGAVEWVCEKYMSLLQEVTQKTHIKVISVEEGSQR